MESIFQQAPFDDKNDIKRIEAIAKEVRLTFKNPKIRIGTGRPEWGAEPSKQYFVITWEEALVTEEQNIEARR